jgi:hypothetical protein
MLTFSICMTCTWIIQNQDAPSLYCHSTIQTCIVTLQSKPGLTIWTILQEYLRTKLIVQWQCQLFILMLHVSCPSWLSYLEMKRTGLLLALAVLNVFITSAVLNVWSLPLCLYGYLSCSAYTHLFPTTVSDGLSSPHAIYSCLAFVD